MTFRSCVSIGLTSVVNAIPAGENADQYFDHRSFAGCHHQVQDVHTVFLSQPYFLIGSFVLDVFSTAILVKKELVPVLHDLTY